MVTLLIYMMKKKYYHIYFDNSNNEIERNFLKENEKVKMIKIIIDYQITSFNTLFQNCGCISSIYFKRFYRNNITEMAGMFSYCSSLQEINLSKFNADKVTNMRYEIYVLWMLIIKKVRSNIEMMKDA